MNSVCPTSYPDVNAVIEELVNSAQTALGDNFVAAYLQGSSAVGDFDNDSDVDFLVVIQEEISDSQLSRLQSMHARIYALASPWAQHLEGSYITRDALKRYDQKKGQLWFLDNTFSVLIRSDHCNTQVVRWVVRERGITLAGPEPKSLIDLVTADDLRCEVLVTMRDWAAQLFAEPEQMNNRWYQPYAVLSYCRMLQTLHTGTVESKRVAAEWGKANLDGKWTSLIERAWNEQPNPSLKVRQVADPDDFESALHFIEYAIVESSRYL